MYIKRHIEKVIKESEKTYPVTLITGPRQVGKSRVLKELYPKLNYETLDSPFLLSNIKDDPIGFLRLQGTPCIIDEIQKAPELFTSIKYIVDNNKKDGMYFLTGSQKFPLMKGVSESLAGRATILNMLGFSNREIYSDSFDLPFLPIEDYLLNRQTKINLSTSEIWQRIHKGSMPRLYENESINWQRYYADYVNTYLERDIHQLEQVGDTLSFLQFMTELASRTGELLNMGSIAKDIGVSAPTIKRWLSILEKSNIIFLLQPFSLNVNKRVIKTPKVYFTDTGLVCYLCKWTNWQVLQSGAMAGQIYETFVISEILKSYYNTGLEPSMYFFRDTNGAEVDILLYQNNTLYPIEIKKTTNPNLKDIKHFKTLADAFPSTQIGEGGVICGCDKLYSLGENNKIIPLSYI